MISEDGFLSPQISNWVTVHRKRNAEWFALAADLNRLCFKTRVAIENGGALERWKFIACALFLKTHESLQAALILAERGLTGDAKNVIRSAFEGVFSLGACKDAGIIDKLASADLRHKKKTARALLGLPADIGLEAAAADRMQKYLDDNPEKGEDLEVWAMAQEAGMEHMYRLCYASLSNEATHPSVASLERFIAQDDTDIRGFQHGPDVPDVAQVVATVCVVAFAALRFMMDKFPSPEIEAALSAEFPRYSELLTQTFPDRVQSNEQPA